jgi:hypothetical protein
MPVVAPTADASFSSYIPPAALGLALFALGSFVGRAVARTAAKSPKLQLHAVAQGEEAPDFSLPDETGRMLSLDSFRDCQVLIWWFPQADTPG